MLPPHFTNLVETVRNLNLEIVSKGDKEAIRVPGDARDLPEKLIALQKALMAFDEAEANGAADSYSFLILANTALISAAKKKGDKRNTYEIVNDAITKYGNDTWAGGGKGDDFLDPIRSKNRSLKTSDLDDAVNSSKEWKAKSLAKAKQDIKAREKQQEKDDTADPPSDAPTI